MRGAGFNYPFLTRKERDGETGLDYFGARYYASTQGRFSSPDPLLQSGDLKLPQIWNHYSYCLNSPLNFVDPKGMFLVNSEQAYKDWWVKKNDTTKHPEWLDGNPPPGEDYEPTLFYLYRNVQTGKYWALNPFKNESAETDTLDEASGIYNGYIINQALGDAPRLPDAVQGSWGLFVGQTYTLAADGQSFVTPLDVYPRKPMSGFKFKWGASINLIWLDQATTPTSAELRNTFTGCSAPLK